MNASSRILRPLARPRLPPCRIAGSNSLSRLPRRYSTSPNPPPHPPSTTTNEREDAEHQNTGNPSEEKPSRPAITDNWESFKEKIRGWSEDATINIRKRADEMIASAAPTFSQLGSELNKVTGYGEIESLKRRVVEQEARIEAARQAAREAKQAYEQAVSERANSQREVNDLLQRKSSWTDSDVSRFTALVRQDHLYEQAETRAKLAAAQTEAAVEHEFTELMRVILNRYHEEQIWSDKIRSASTYGSLAVLALNLIVFISAIVVVEPWKRRRLAQTFERKVEEMAAATAASFEKQTEDLNAHLKGQDELLAQLMETAYYSTQPPSNLNQDEQQRQISGEVAFGEIDQAGDHGTPAKPSRENELVVAVATTATVAGLLGWFMRSWFRP